MCRFVAFLLLYALGASAFGGLWAAPAPVLKQTRVETLIARLRHPTNRLKWGGMTFIPGGESIRFSPAMKDLIAVGATVRAPLHRLLDDKQIQNEIILVLGAIGDETTIPLLIDRYPTSKDPGDPLQTKMVCFSFALSFLTCQQLDRTREGTTISESNAQLWRNWWTGAGATFRVPAEKPNATWVPGYPRD